MRHYVEVLGFEKAPWGDEEFTCVSRDGARIYLCEGGQGQPGSAKREGSRMGMER